MNFDELLNEELEGLGQVDEYLEGFWLASATEEELEEVREELGMEPEEFEAYVAESLVKRVSSSGEVTKTRTRKARSQRASRTTGLSKQRLKMRARKAAKTRKRNPGAVKKSIKKRRRAMRKRKSLGIK